MGLRAALITVVVLSMTALPCWAQAQTRRAPTTAPTRELRQRQIPPRQLARSYNREQLPEVLQPVSPEAHVRAMGLTREWAERITTATGVQFAELETEHFLIFHNWDKREERFLIENVEGCYAAISRQFNVNPRETVFAGKPPLFMIAGEEAYAAAIRSIDPSINARSFIGLAATSSDGAACIIMQKPTKADSEDLRRTEKRWASTLAHEMTHLFAARYRSDRPLPGWLNEGIAEVMEARLFPELVRPEQLALLLSAPDHVERLMSLPRPENGQEYARMQTMVETLIAHDADRFLQLVIAIKDGQAPVWALESVYGWTLGDFQQHWLEHLRQVYKARPRPVRER